MEPITILKDNKQLGPYTHEEARFLLSQGFISAEELAWTPSLSTWVPLDSILFQPPVAARPPELPPAAVQDIQQTTVLETKPVQSPVRGIRLWDIVWCAVGIVALWNFGLESIVVPVGVVAGLLLAYIGCSAIIPVRQLFYSVMPASKAALSEVGYIILSLFLALVAAALLWEPLFTFRSWIFWHEVAEGPVYLWFFDTCLFGYGFFMARRASRAAAEAPNNALQRTTGATEIRDQRSLARRR